MKHETLTAERIAELERENARLRGVAEQARGALIDCADNLRLTRRELRILAQHVVPYSNTQAQHNNEAIIRADEAIAAIRAALTGGQP